MTKKLIFLIIFNFITFFDNISKAQKILNFNRNIENYQHKIQVINSQKKVKANFMAAIADTEEKRSYGLMNLANLTNHQAMLFLFEEEMMINMWMKNTLIDLDMIFIDKNNKIINIKTGAKKLSLQIISSKYPVNKVLEIKAGLAEKFNIKIGDYIYIK